LPVCQTTNQVTTLCIAVSIDLDSTSVLIPVEVLLLCTVDYR